MVSFVFQKCGWTLADDVFTVDFSVSLKPLPPQSVHDHVALSAASSVHPVTLSWDFGDLSSRVNTTGTDVTAATHKYGLPGQYAVSVMAWAGNKEVRQLRPFVHSGWVGCCLFIHRSANARGGVGHLCQL